MSRPQANESNPPRDDLRVMYEMHSHTPLCRHATGEPTEYAAAAWQRGLRGIAITCHNPLPDGISQLARMYQHQMPEYVQIVEQARREWAGRVDVLLGLECDFLPGLEQWLERQLSEHHFHHVLGSVHPQIGEYQSAFWRDDPVEFQLTYFSHLADAAETGLFDTLSHPDLVKNSTPEHWRLDRIVDHVRRCLDRIAKSGVAMELNTSGLDKLIPEMNPGIEILREMRLRGIPVVIGADAHVPQRVGDRFELALDQLREVGYTRVSHFIARRRQDVPIEIARRSLQAAEPARSANPG